VKNTTRNQNPAKAYPSQETVVSPTNRMFVQRTLEVGQSGDFYERQADAMADMVMRESSDGGEISTPPAGDGISAIQRSGGSSAFAVSPGMESQLSSSRGGGNALPPVLRSQMEGSFGFDFSAVRLHTDAPAAQMSSAINARAFTHDNDIYFNEGQFQPQTQSGKHLLAHELTHTVQQGAGVARNRVQRWKWPNPLDLTYEEQRERFLFRSGVYGPITYHRPEIIGSGFEASYYPMASRLNVTVRGKVRFADTLINNGGTLSSPNYFMNQSNFVTIMNGLPTAVKAQIMPYLQWTNAEKQIHIARFRQNVEAATALWQDAGMSFQVNEAGWEDVTATPKINIDITEGDALHQTTNGEGGSTVTDKRASDHLQIEIVKQPTDNDVLQIQQIIANYDATAGTTIGDTVTNQAVQGVRSYLGNDEGSRRSAPEGFNNFMSLSSNVVNDHDVKKRIYASVFFAHNKSNLSRVAIETLDNLFKNEILSVNANRAIDIILRGYASASGSEDYNRALVDRRIASVKNYIDKKIRNPKINTYIDSSTITNDANTSAEADLAANPATHNPAFFRSVDIEIEGYGQNVLAHEFGHVFGLGDEYAEVGNGYNRPAGTKATHDPLAKDAGVSGGAIVRDDNRMMSAGNVVGPAHYSTFADALKQLTGKQWKIVN